MAQSNVGMANDTEGFDYAYRMRAEAVDIGGQHGFATTAKVRLDFSKTFSPKWQAMLQVDHVASLFDSHHSDGVRLTGEPVIADPAGTEINQAFVQFSHGNAELTLGRQLITFGDHRFVGDVGFRQNDQTYDAARLHFKTVEGVRVDYAWVSQVNRIFGRQAGRSIEARDVRFGRVATRPGALLGEHDVDAHLLNVEWTLADYIDLAAFAFTVHNHDHAPFSNRTIGVSADWQYKYRRLGLNASLIVARQQKQKVNAGQYQDFVRLGFGVRQGAWRLEYRSERFSSSHGQAFVTPLATLHKFQGWADQFLVTPAAGLDDSSLRLMWKARPFTVDYRFHRFTAVDRPVSGSRGLGKEHNLDLIYKPNRKHEVKIRFARYLPEAKRGIGSSAVEKLFVMYSYGF